MALLDHRITSAYYFVWGGDGWADLLDAHAATADIEPDAGERMARLLTARYTQHLDLMIDLAVHSLAELELIAADAGYPVPFRDDDAPPSPVMDAMFRVRRLVERRFGEMFDVEAATSGARSGEAAVRMFAAKHPLLPVTEIEALLDDPDPSVRVVALGRVDGPVAARYVDDGHRFVRRALARHPQASPDVLGVLAADDDVGVRHGVALNERVPGAVLEQLTRDPTALVANVAARRLARGRHDRAPVPHRDLLEAVFVLTIDPNQPSPLRLEPNPFGFSPTDVFAEDLPFYGSLVAHVEHVQQSPPDSLEAGELEVLARGISDALSPFSPWWAVVPPRVA